VQAYVAECSTACWPEWQAIPVVGAFGTRTLYASLYHSLYLADQVPLFEGGT